MLEDPADFAGALRAYVQSYLYKRYGTAALAKAVRGFIIDDKVQVFLMTSANYIFFKYDFCSSIQRSGFHSLQTKSLEN